MANTTFTGPVVALNGFIGGPNPNAQDTAQGGKTPWTVSTSNVVQMQQQEKLYLLLVMKV
jgi:hypothetical protein